MSTDFIRYDLLVQDAMMGVVKRVLADAAREGLPGEHHFFITFKTRHPGVKISKQLLARFEDEITIVLQHQFWDLVSGEHGFEVGLSFNDVPEKLVVPYEAICGFYDPSVHFALKFEVADIDEDDMEEDEPVLGRRGTRTASDDAEPLPVVPLSVDRAERSDEAADGGSEPTSTPEDAPKVVSLDHFRKKK